MTLLFIIPTGWWPGRKCEVLRNREWLEWLPEERAPLGEGWLQIHHDSIYMFILLSEPSYQAWVFHRSQGSVFWMMATHYKNYFKSLWKPKEKSHRLVSMRRSAFFNSDACPVWSPLASCGCWAVQEDQVRIVMSTDYKTALDFDDCKIRQQFESTVC